MNLLGLPIITLASIGLITIIYYLIIPILDILFYAAGYTVLTLLNVNYRKAKKVPLKFLIAIMKTYKSGLIEAVSFMRCTRITQGNWIWIPLFKFKRINPKNCV